MSLNKVTYVDGTTVIHADNLNDIQDEIISQESALESKANKSTTYTKTEVNKLVSEIPAVDAYTKDETNRLLNAKSDKNNTYTKTETYNKTEVDQKISEVPALNTYTKTEIDEFLDDKSDKEDTYTKEEVDQKISEVPALDAYTKAQTNALLNTRESKGKLTIEGVEYEVVVSDTDAGQAGKIVFYTGNEPAKRVIFEDSGLPETVNDDYTVIHDALHTIQQNGTKIYSLTSLDGFYRANQLIMGDFEVEFSFVEGGNIYYPEVAFLDSENNVLWTMDHRQEAEEHLSGYFLTYDTQQKISIGAIDNLETWKITRKGNRISLYADGELIIDYVGIPRDDVYFAWKTHAHSNRWYRFRNLKIYGYEG